MTKRSIYKIYHKHDAPNFKITCDRQIMLSMSENGQKIHENAELMIEKKLSLRRITKLTEINFTACEEKIDSKKEKISIFIVRNTNR